MAASDDGGGVSFVDADRAVHDLLTTLICFPPMASLEFSYSTKVALLVHLMLLGPGQVAELVVEVHVVDDAILGLPPDVHVGQVRTAGADKGCLCASQGVGSRPVVPVLDAVLQPLGQVRHLVELADHGKTLGSRKFYPRPGCHVPTNRPPGTGRLS